MQPEDASTPQRVKPPPNRSEQYAADWHVPLPSSCKPQHVFPLIQAMLIVGFSWDRFIWDLRELLRLLRGRPCEFNYLYVVRLLRARAAFLAGGDSFSLCNAVEIREGIAAGCVQFVSIYLRLFLTYLGEAVENGFYNGKDELFRIAIMEMEETYLDILQACCLDPDSDEEFLGLDVKSWASGTERLGDGSRVTALPESVQVPVRIEERRGRKRVKPGKRECLRKLRRKETCYSFDERIGRAIPTDVELERLCSLPLTGGGRTVRYEDLCFEYYETQTNHVKTTLYVLCADRMMRIEQADGKQPGSHPKKIEYAYLDALDESTYIVHFDNGDYGLFKLSFRAHMGVDRERIPADVRQAVRHNDLALLNEWSDQLLLPAASKSPKLALPTSTGTSSVAARPDASTVPDSSLDGGVAEENPTTKHAGADGERPIGDDRGRVAPSIKIIGNYSVIRIGDEEVVFGAKYKRRSFVRFLHERKQRTGEDTFYFEEMKDEFERVTGKPIRSDRFEEDFFRGQSREFHLLFEEVDKASGRYRLKV